MSDPQRVHTEISIDSVDNESESSINQQPATINNSLDDRRHCNNNNNNNNTRNNNQPFYNKIVDDFSIVHIYRTLDCPVICFLPQRVGYYSCKLNPDGLTDTYLADKSSLTYLRPNYGSLVNLDLLEGLRGQANEIKGFLIETDHIFQWITNEPRRDLYLSNVTFICTTADILRSLMYSPYNDAVTWLIFAIKINRKIYLTKRNPNSLLKHGPLTKDQFIGKYLEYQFNELLTLSQDGSPAPAHVNGNRHSFYTVNKLEIGQHRILYPCRIDCTVDRSQYDKPLEQMEFSLTTTRPYPGLFPQKSGSNINRTIQWWVGGFLSGADTIVCGDKTAQFRVGDVKTYQTETMTTIQSRTAPNAKWTPKVCIDNLKKVLTHIGAHCHNENVVYGFRWDRDRVEVEFRTIKKPVTNFIPDWYLGGGGANANGAANPS